MLIISHRSGITDMHETKYEHDVSNPLDNVSEKDADVDISQRSRHTELFTWNIRRQEMWQSRA